MKTLFNILSVIFTLIGIAAICVIYYNKCLKKRYIQVEEVE